MALTLAAMIGSARATVREVPPVEACAALDRAEFALVVDVREPGEYRDGHLPAAVNVPRGLLEIRADPSSPAADGALCGAQSGRILVYCTKGPGARSLLAAQTLASMGYDGAEVLAGGLNAWAESGLPIDEPGEES